MKLTTEKNDELKKLSRYFEKIETIASKMGVEVEDLMQEFKNNNTAAYANFKKSILAITKRRQSIFRNDKINVSKETPPAGMSIINKEESRN